MIDATQSRTKYSLYNALSAIMLTLVNGILGIVVTRLIINTFGSDFNGLNSTANQIINVLLILEGGFTLASNVALFGPISRKDYETSNAVISSTRNKFRRISIYFLLIGVMVSLIYAMAAKTSLDREFVFTVIIMAVVPQAFYLYYTTTYVVILQTQQCEYIVSGLTALTIGLGHITNIILVLNQGEMWMVRFVTMLFAILNCFLIAGYTKKKNTFIDFSVQPQPQLIKGTRDVMAQKITGVIYTSWPIIFLSISSNGGTMLASVYAVYNSVFIMIKALLHGVIDAPRLGFGQMLTEQKRESIWPIYKQYELVAVLATFIMLTTACALILPFITIYTDGVDDINYYDVKIAVLMTAISATELLHIPSGHIINMSGNFKISKYFQIIACAVLIVSMSIMGSMIGVYGMLYSLLVVAILLAVLEIGFVHLSFFEHRIWEFIFMALPFIIVGILVSYVEMNYVNGINNVMAFLKWGVALTMLNSLAAIVISYVFCKNEFVNILRRGSNLLKGFTASN